MNQNRENPKGKNDKRKKSNKNIVAGIVKNDIKGD